MNMQHQQSSEQKNGARMNLRRDNESLAAKLGVVALSLRVEQVELLTPSFKRIVLVGDDLANIDPFPGQDLMIAIDEDGARVRRRRYTIRHFDRRHRQVIFDVALHGDGPGMRWALSSEPGQEVEAVGPRGKIGLDANARWHLFVGDDAFAPAALVMAEAVPPQNCVVLAIEIDGHGHEQPQQIQADVSGPRWIHRDAGALGDPARLLEAVERLPLPPGPGHAYVGGEHRVVNALKDALLARGMDARALSVKPYWRRGRQNAANGEPERT
jgi:NADPH-dependent ferric siderophore reductase